MGVSKIIGPDIDAQVVRLLLLGRPKKQFLETAIFIEYL